MHKFKLAGIGLLLSGCASNVTARPATSQELKNFFNSSYKVCWDGTKVKSSKACPPQPSPTPTPTPTPPPPPPPPATQTCWDGSVILATAICPPVPPPPPPPPPIPAPSFSVQDLTVSEAQSVANVQIVKSGANGSPSTFTYTETDGIASAGKDYVRVTGTMNVLDSTTIVTIPVPIIDDKIVDGNENFNLTITPVTNATALKPAGVVTILDVDVPPPAPSPPPPPASTGWIAAVDLGGLAPIASNFDYNSALQPSWGSGAIPPSSSPDVVGAFRFIMREAGRNSDDAIVFPGQCGVSHAHQYYGRKGWTCTSTYENMRASAGTGGNDYNNFLAVNGSGYWTPELLDGSNNPATLSFVSAYYKRRPISDPKCGGLGTTFGAEGKCVNLPNGLRLIAGYDLLTGKSPTGQMWFNCQGPTAVPGHYANLTLALANCPTNTTNLIGFVIDLPNCWDGKNVDSPNHRDHVNYMTPDVNSGQLSCDLAHPYVIPQLTLGAWFSSVAGAHFSCDSMLPAGTPPGTCGHVDYFMNWDPVVAKMFHDNCIDKKLNASGGDLCNGLQMKGAQ